MADRRAPAAETTESPPHPFPHPFEVESFERRMRTLHAREPYLIPRAEIPSHFSRSSVLICFWREASDLRVLLTKRAESLRGHPGQMSFPGGRLQPLLEPHGPGRARSLPSFLRYKEREAADARTEPHEREE